MKYSRLALPGLLLAASAAALACGDSSPLAPQTAAPSAVAFSQGSHAGNLAVCDNAAPTTVTREIGPNGGLITVGRHMLWVPKGALNEPVQITATAKANGTNTVHFEPEGLQFAVPATIVMSYTNCRPTRSHLRVAYVSDSGEILYYVPSDDRRGNKFVVGQIEHFSDYAVAW